MTFNWKHYMAAAVIVGAALLKSGAPLVAVILGLAGAAAYGIMKFRRA